MYQIVFEIDIKKYLKKFPKKDAEKILATIALLSQEPRQRWIEKLKNRSGYRIRVGNYRIIYTVDEEKLLVIVFDVDDRKDVNK